MDDSKKTQQNVADWVEIGIVLGAMNCINQKIVVRKLISNRLIGRPTCIVIIAQGDWVKGLLVEWLTD